MRKEIILAMMLLVSSLVSATETTLTQDILSMDYVDSKAVDYCMTINHMPANVNVIITNVCKDVDGLYGCQASDIFNPIGFSVSATDVTTGTDGCTKIIVDTNVEENDGGVFYFTVNGQIAGTTIGLETGKVYVNVPEFTTLGAITALGLAGLFVWKKRKGV